MNTEAFVAEWARTKKHKTWIEAYVQDRDRGALPDSEAVNAAIDSYPLDNETFDALNDRQPASLVHEGKVVLRFLAVHQTPEE